MMIVRLFNEFNERMTACFEDRDSHFALMKTSSCYQMWGGLTIYNTNRIKMWSSAFLWSHSCFIEKISRINYSFLINSIDYSINNLPSFIEVISILPRWFHELIIHSYFKKINGISSEIGILSEINLPGIILQV